MTGRSRLRLAAGLAGIVASLGAGVVAGRHVTSPTSAAAHAHPPPSRDVTARLARRDLRTAVTAVGHRRAAGGYPLVVGAVAGPDSIVTSVAIRPGRRLGDGTLLADVSGAPLIAMVLPFPLYRDISVGDTGPDVLAVTDALARLGYLDGGSRSASVSVRSAVATLARDRGYPDLLSTPARGAVVVQRRWFVRIDRPGRFVSSVGVRVGSVIADPGAVIAHCDVTPPVVDTVVDRDAGASIRKGDAVVVTDNGAGNSVTGSVDDVGPRGPDGVPVRIGGDAREFARLSDDLVVSVTSRLVSAPVLAAPVTALYTDVDGRTHVLVPSAGADRAVGVTLGPCAAGWCEIKQSDRALAPGDEVVVGGPGSRSGD